MADKIDFRMETVDASGCHRQVTVQNDGDAYLLTMSANYQEQARRRFSDMGAALKTAVAFANGELERICASCGRPGSNHPFRHPFVPVEPRRG
jgi:hypothetical protein